MVTMATGRLRKVIKVNTCYEKLIYSILATVLANTTLYVQNDNNSRNIQE